MLLRGGAGGQHIAAASAGMAAVRRGRGDDGAGRAAAAVARRLCSPAGRPRPAHRRVGAARAVVERELHRRRRGRRGAGRRARSQGRLSFGRRDLRGLTRVPGAARPGSGPGERGRGAPQGAAQPAARAEVRAQPPRARRLLPGRPGGDDARVPERAVPVPRGRPARGLGGGADVRSAGGRCGSRLGAERLDRPGPPGRPGDRPGRGRLGPGDHRARAGPGHRRGAGVPGPGRLGRHAERDIPGHAVESDHPGRAAGPDGGRRAAQLRARAIRRPGQGGRDGQPHHARGLGLVWRADVHRRCRRHLRGAPRVRALPRGRGAAASPAGSSLSASETAR